MYAYVLDDHIQTMPPASGVAYVVGDGQVTLAAANEGAPAPVEPPIPSPPTPAPPLTPVQGGGGGVALYPSMVYGEQDDEAESNPAEPEEQDAPDIAAHMLAERMSSAKHSAVVIRLAWRMRKKRP